MIRQGAVAAMDHSEVVAPELGPRPGESAADRARRIDAVVASRVPDVRVLLSALTGPRPMAALEPVMCGATAGVTRGRGRRARSAPPARYRAR
jgi:hypothetical protein